MGGGGVVDGAGCVGDCWLLVVGVDVLLSSFVFGSAVGVAVTLACCGCRRPLLTLTP